ncbi:unnamed protein product [Protopolystoma xenopodis]|uniref:G-protein coupled receptors family 1 profile domain-containing protein n=1 Tax=Protopolystoma xenopodis TaxID=117903 RepID=A0A3S5AI36_9PLAT|nr:unnamed protein product [Protopolystoma xenopodis]
MAPLQQSPASMFHENNRTVVDNATDADTRPAFGGARSPWNYARFELAYGELHVYFTAILLGTIILCTIVGNVFVVAAIILERNLQVSRATKHTFHAL